MSIRNLKITNKSLTDRRKYAKAEVKRLINQNRAVRETSLASEKINKIVLRNLWQVELTKYHGKWEARHHHLAYGFLRGVPYEAMEHKCVTPPDTSYLYKIAIEYHSLTRLATLEAWLKGEAMEKAA